MWYFFPSEGGELIPWCPEVVLYIIQPGIYSKIIFYCIITTKTFLMLSDIVIVDAM